MSSFFLPFFPVSVLWALGASQNQVLPFYIQKPLCITYYFDICLQGARKHLYVSTLYFILFYFFAFCVHYFGFADGLFILLIPRRATLCKRRASHIGGSNRFKKCYQRCMLLQWFGSSDEASGEAVKSLCVCVSNIGSALRCVRCA